MVAGDDTEVLVVQAFLGLGAMVSVVDFLNETSAGIDEVDNGVGIEEVSRREHNQFKERANR